jgi:hypothetical protein
MHYISTHYFNCLQLQAWRAHVVRKEVQKRCAALAVITRMLPQMLAACEKRRQERRMRAIAAAATPIQAAVRGWIQRRSLRRQQLAAVTIQAYLRGRAARAACSHEVCQELVLFMYVCNLCCKSHSACISCSN